MLKTFFLNQGEFLKLVFSVDLLNTVEPINDFQIKYSTILQKLFHIYQIKFQKLTS